MPWHMSSPYLVHMIIIQAMTVPMTSALAHDSAVYEALAHDALVHDA